MTPCIDDSAGIGCILTRSFDASSAEIACPSSRLHGVDKIAWRGSRHDSGMQHDAEVTARLVGTCVAKPAYMCLAS